MDDEIFSTNGIITLQVLPSQGYEVAKINSSATLSIIDNDFLPGISIVAEKAVITEGEAIRFLIRAGEISSNDRTILLQNEIVGNFIATTIPATTFLSAGNQETVYSIPTINDTVPEIGGAVTITLATNPDYTITQANSSASVNILDDDTPLGISILPITERVVEGEMAEFQISTSSPYVDDTDVNILVTGTGDFFVNPDGIQTVSIPALEEFVVVKIPTVDNSIYQLDGEVRAEIKSGEKYTVSITNNQASIVVQDNDLPIVSIAGSTSIEEGEDLPISIEASTEPLRDLSIALAVSQTGDFLLKSDPNHIVLPAGQRAITEQMTTYDDLEDELDGEISVTIQSGAGYSVADTPNDRIITTISDNDLNTISISASSVTITEAETAEFIVHSTLPVTTAFPVNISLNQLGQFIDNLITEQTITFEVGDEANRIEIDLVDDEILEVNGQLTAQITSGDDYVIAASPNNVAIIELRDNDTPILSISGTTPIEEGETAEFVITSTEVAQQPIQIQVSAVIDGIQVGNSPPNQVEIGVGQNSTTIAIPTINDDEIGLTGQITISLQESADFILSSDQAEATISVLNNDFPELSISAQGDVIEGTDTHAEFTISATPAPLADLAIALNISQVGNYIAGDPIESITMFADAETVNILVPLQNNEVEETDGQITVEIQSGSGYQIDSDHQSVSLNVSNDDNYFVAINANATQIVEGDTIEYMVTMTPPAPQGGIRVVVNHAGEGQFVSNFEEVLEFSDGESQKTYSVQTTSDNLYTADGQVTATITAENNFSIRSGEGRIITKITDDDAPGGISIVPIAQSISEGETARFQITASQSSNLERSINVAITETGSFIRNRFLLPDFVTIEAGQRTTMIEVDTEADGLIESDGNITGTILSGENYLPAKLYASASVQVLNEDLVTLSISALNPQITEGLPIKLTVHSSPVAPQQEMVLNFTYEVTGEFLQETPIREFLITPSDFIGQEAEIDIAQTVNDAIFEANGLMVAELVSGPDYLVAGEPNNSTNITIVDNDEPAGVAIAPVNTDVNEGHDIVFQITASSTEPVERRINLGINELAGSYLAEIADHIIIPANSRSAMLSIATLDNQVQESNGSVSVMIEEGPDYEVTEEFNIAFASIADNDQPLISIRAGDEITEDQLAEFTIQSTTISTLDLTIPLEYSQNGNFAEIADFPATVIIPAGETEIALELAIIDDNTHEQDGRIATTLVAGTDYLIDDVEYTAAVNVKDNDLPTISISGIEDITEGEVAEFMITADFAPQFDLTINLLSETLEAGSVNQTANPFAVTLVTGEITKLSSNSNDQ